MAISKTFIDHFSTVKDPRRANKNRRHQLLDILVITIVGTICGAEGWNELCDFAQSKQTWLETFLALPNGIPSYDTFARVFSLINPCEFDKCFSSWIASLAIDVKNATIAIDGKTLRGSHNRRKGQLPTHLVSAWSSKHKLLLAQVKTPEKSNEIEAIPRLLNMIDVRDSIVTIDAMGCQQKIAKQIKQQGADYILALKENQPSLHKDVSTILRNATEGEKHFKKMLHRCRVEKIKSHGRLERRRYTLLSARDLLLFDLRWPGMKSIGMIETKRTVNHETTHSIRWSLDVSFNEDHSRVRSGHSAENLATIRRVALNLLKQETSMKAGITRKRKRAGWDNHYLLAILHADKKHQDHEKSEKL